MSKTYEELKQLAQDLISGHVFTDRSVRDVHMLKMVFMPLAFIESQEDLDSIRVQYGDGGMFYEYMEKAGPRSVNGMPMFMSVNILSTEDTKQVFEIVDKLNAAIAAV